MLVCWGAGVLECWSGAERRPPVRTAACQSDEGCDAGVPPYPCSGVIGILPGLLYFLAYPQRCQSPSEEVLIGSQPDEIPIRSRSDPDQIPINSASDKQAGGFDGVVLSAAIDTGW